MNIRMTLFTKITIQFINYTKVRNGNKALAQATAMPYPLKEVIKDRTNAIKHVVMTNWGEGNMLEVGERRLNKMGLSASEDFFKVFSFNMVRGDPNTALNDPTSIVITESTAQAFFENQDPINQLIKIDNGQELKVTGVIKDLPKQSAFRFDYVLPFGYLESTQGWVHNSKDNWNNNSFQCMCNYRKILLKQKSTQPFRI
jgi:putative ABC transport system permease protein